MKRTRRPSLPIEDLATHPEVFVSAEQLAAYWGVDVSTIRKWHRTATLPGVHLGRALRFRRSVALNFEQAGALKRPA